MKLSKIFIVTGWLALAAICIWLFAFRGAEMLMWYLEANSPSHSNTACNCSLPDCSKVTILDAWRTFYG